MTALILRLTLLLFVLSLSTTSLYAQNKTIEKPEKKTTTTTTTTTTQQKPRTNTRNNSQSSSSNSTTTTATKLTTGTINGHEWVDLGLSVKWATCNVGASSPSDYGNYYAWGETSTKSEYTLKNSKMYGKSLGNIAGNPQYDAARANWGNTWRLPTLDEMMELVDKCTWTWISKGGHNGYRVTGHNGNCIFIPAAALRYGASLRYAGENGYFWSATPAEGNNNGAYGLSFHSGLYNRFWNYRYYGMSVRPVSE